MKRKLLSLALCLALTLSMFGASVPDATAADAGRTVCTFGSAEGPFRDLAQEAAQRKKAKKKPSLSDRDRDQREKIERMKARRNGKTG